MSSEDTGIRFSNTIEDSLELNVLNYPFMYNGGGVAIGDINNDGLPDIFLAGNRVSSRLYLNKGEMQFEDITESAGVSTDKWISGVSMVDINNNGYLDIYLSVVSPESAPSEERSNLLFVNNGDNTFTESAADFGIHDTGFTTHAAFLDYNGNGYLDLYLLNHSPGSFYFDMVNIEGSSDEANQSVSFDRLYRNNGDGTFTDVSKEAGLLEKTGYGLGVVVADFNRNGWPDIYISNDIAPNDVLYINNKDGTFTDKLSDYLKHTSFAGMGVDAADFNNDGWPDILQVDMMPEDYTQRKVMSGGTGYEHFLSMREQGYDYYYSKNSLQLNRGTDHQGDLVFSEMGRVDGVAYTEWSWGALFGDYNNSGFKDILITNGYPKAVNNYDYLVEMNNARRFGTEEAQRKRRYEILQNLPGIHHHNYLFRNEGNLRFTDVSAEWGFSEPSYSFGVAHGDLDNNGSLDVVINNIDAPASVYRNNSSGQTDNNFFRVSLFGDSVNKRGIGAEVILSAGGEKQYVYQTPWRGYQSTVEDKIHFGLGQTDHIDSLEVIWPDGRYQLLENPEVNQLTELHYENSRDNKPESLIPNKENQRFKEITNTSGLTYKHKEREVNDFNVQPLLPYQHSMPGPKMAVGDVTGNGLDDLFIGASAGFTAVLYLQQDDGTFRESIEQQPWQMDRLFEDSGAVFFDSNGNGLLDLYVSSGGFDLSPASDRLQDRLYLNTGEGMFIKVDAALPQMLTSSSCVVPGDFNGNGRTDLFVGGGVVPGKYPYPARSYILRNDGGSFTDVTEEVAPELVKPGMITDAVWMDFDDDGRLDLVTVGKWLPVQFYKNDDGRLKEVTGAVTMQPERGWWYSLEKGDFNNDGHTDLIAGNAGLNFTYKTSDNKKFGVLANDFNNNMRTDIIFTIQENGTQYPFFGKPKLGNELRFLNSRFPTFESFANASAGEIFQEDNLTEALNYQVDTFASVYLENNGDGTFKAVNLPVEAQLSAVKEIISHDVDGDGNPDIILAGNIFKTEPDTPRLDAGSGVWLRGDGNGNFTPVEPYNSGFWAPLDVKDLKLLHTPNGKAVVVANNSDSVQVFSIEK
ncbi:MAG: VCBS repeat-containing protein [Balneolaceae bacterium]